MQAELEEGLVLENENRGKAARALFEKIGDDGLHTEGTFKVKSKIGGVNQSAKRMRTDP